MQKDCIGLSKWELDTPCLVIDIDVLEQNIGRMREFADSVGKRLRPHVKTHKCSKIARMQMDAGAVGLCAAKVSEAEGLIYEGFSQILVTSPVVSSQKIDRLMACLKKAPELMAVVDNSENAEALSSATEKTGASLGVLVGVDPGLRRTGASYENAIELARCVDSLPGLALKGIQCYAGHLQHVNSYESRKDMSLDCMGKAAELFRQLKAAGLPCEIFSGVGTGTYNIDSNVKDITDFQVGSYVVMDTEYMEIGSASSSGHFDDFKPALTLLSTVVSVNQDDWVTIDAGLKALYFTPHAPPRVVAPKGRGLQYEWFGDEHGRILFHNAGDKPDLGSVVELTASHCDPTINLFNSFYIIRNDVVVDRWEIDLRGCSQ